VAIIRAEYIWLDGQRPTAKMRCKTKIIDNPKGKLDKIPAWGFDGSSTCQADGKKSDCDLNPVCLLPDPIRGGKDILVLCEVLAADGQPHPSNTRAALRSTLIEVEAEELKFGIEQEFTLYDKDGVRPLRWPSGAGYPAPQGNYYCGVGADEVFGRSLVEQHTAACLKAGIDISGTNGEVCPSQWEFQVGPVDALEVCDQLWLARWLLYRLGEDFDIVAKLHPKPIKEGDWNGAGAHVNFSTKAMREEGGLGEIERACQRLQHMHKQHVVDHVYGELNAERLTGSHETASIDHFHYGVGDRTASVRIPRRVADSGKGYLEDRRPAANMDPYRVCTALLQTICCRGAGFDPNVFSYFAVR